MLRRVVVAGEPEPPVSGHLAMGEEAGLPDAITVDSRHLWRGGRPWFPVMGEFHYARYPAAEWREELLKVRAGGVTAVATYVFWNLHEERRGRFDWSGDRDLRRFVDTCAEAGLDVVVRIGPWGHGESRNGGFPDWLPAADCVPRTDDPRYLDLVRPFFAQIGRQLRGLTRREGGPIVGIQLENELYDQPGHLLTLKRMAKEAGLDAPLWTATGWGHAQLPPAEVIPVFGGYAEAAWDAPHDGWPAQSRAHYFFGPGRDDDSIGADLRAAGTAAEDESHLAHYPFATCELGGGMYTSYHRRPIVGPADVAALALVKLGSGSVWQGYYMYHGGSQQIGELSTLQESHATGYPNDVPVINYDFQAPLGEYGQFRESYFRLRLLHAWLAADGADLAPMTLAMPPDAPDDTGDRRALRWCVRSDGRSGFLFVNNHQPVETLPAHEDVRFSVALGGRDLVVPREPVTVPPGASFVWPLVRPVGASTLLTASAQPVCTLEGPVVVLAQVAGIPVELVLDAATVAVVDGPGTISEPGREPVTVTWDGPDVVIRGLRPGPGCLLRLTAPDGSVARVLVLDEDSALAASRVRAWEADRLLLSDRPAVVDGDRLVLYGGGRARLRVFPPPPPGKDGAADGVFGVIDLPAPAAEPVEAVVEQVAAAGPARPAVIDVRSGRASAPTDPDFDGAAVYRVTVPADLLDGLLDGPLDGFLDGGDEVLLRLDWSGDVGRAYIGGRLVADQFWHGQPWEIGLRRFGSDLRAHGGVLELRLLPFPADAPVHVSSQVRARKGLLELGSATFVPVPRTTLAI